MVWAIGRLDLNKEPAFHDLFPKKDILIHFNSTEPYNDCFAFTSSAPVPVLEKWERNKIFDKSIRSFSATLGPSGGKKGYQGITGHVSNGLAWYINGFLVPDLYLRRGLTYSFKVIITENMIFEFNILKKHIIINRNRYEVGTILILQNITTPW